MEKHFSAPTGALPVALPVATSWLLRVVAPSLATSSWTEQAMGRCLVEALRSKCAAGQTVKACESSQ